MPTARDSPKMTLRRWACRGPSVALMPSSSSGQAQEPWHLALPGTSRGGRPWVTRHILSVTLDAHSRKRPAGGLRGWRGGSRCVVADLGRDLRVGNVLGTGGSNLHTDLLRGYRCDHDAGPEPDGARIGSARDQGGGGSHLGLGVVR